MQKVVDQITDQLVGLIQKDQSSYTPKQLLKAGIPNYIVERIRLLLEDKVLSDLQKPSSKWIESDSELLHHAWEDFKRTAFSSSVIPHKDLYEVIHQVIKEIISVFVEPRKNMASYLFREETVLSFEEMSKRCARLTVYKHFGTAIPLYMKKRELNEITLERCQKLISNLDARIVANYSADDWAQKLELLFTLFGGKLDPRLLSLFFADKGFKDAAVMFASIDVAVTQSTFIEMLSKEQMEVSEPEEENLKPEVEEKPVIEVTEEEPENNLASAFNPEKADQDMNVILGDITDEGLVEEHNLEEAQSLNALFVSDQEDEVSKFETSATKEEEQKELRSNLSSILGEAKNSFEGVVNEETETESEELIVEEELIEDPVDEEELVEAEAPVLENEDSTSEENGDDDEKPMWAQFLSADQMEVIMASREEEPSEESSINDSLYVEDEDDELIIEEPEENPNEIPLNGYLHEKESQWIKALFDGNDKEYQAAIKEIEKQENWKQASEYVEIQIFSKEEVDMFSEEAIEFIDALQTYFKEYKS